ncbi:MAG: tetratricopeptide repeat protein [Acidimicrobiia bacterium]
MTDDAGSRFTTSQIADVLDLTPSQIRGFVTAGVFNVEHGTRGRYLFSSADVAVLAMAARLMAAGASTAKVRRALRDLVKSSDSTSADGGVMSGVVLSVVGDEVVARADDASWNMESGQTVLVFDEVLEADIVSLADARMRRAIGMPSDGRTASEWSADDWFIHGDMAEEENEADAEEAYRRALRIDASHPEANLNLGRLLHSRGDPAAALVHYRRVVDAYPNDSLALFNVGVASEDVGAVGQAIKAYRRALESEPSFADAHFNLASIYERTGARDLAVQHFGEYHRLIAAGRSGSA